MKARYARSLLVLLLFCLFCSWTHCPTLEVRTEPLYPCYLASHRINTIDVWNEDFFGEQIVVYYKYPTSGIEEKNLRLTVRYKNHCYETEIFPLSKRRGYWIFRLVNKEYWERGGILSYKVELRAGDQIIKSWKHHLYVDLIEIKKNNSEESVVTLTDLGHK